METRERSSDPLARYRPLTHASTGDPSGVERRSTCLASCSTLPTISAPLCPTRAKPYTLSHSTFFLFFLQPGFPSFSSVSLLFPFARRVSLSSARTSCPFLPLYTLHSCFCRPSVCFTFYHAFRVSFYFLHCRCLGILQLQGRYAYSGDVLG